VGAGAGAVGLGAASRADDSLAVIRRFGGSARAADRLAVRQLPSRWCGALPISKGGRDLGWAVDPEHAGAGAGLRAQIGHIRAALRGTQRTPARTPRGWRGCWHGRGARRSRRRRQAARRAELRRPLGHPVRLAHESSRACPRLAQDLEQAANGDGSALATEARLTRPRPTPTPAVSPTRSATRSCSHTRPTATPAKRTPAPASRGPRAAASSRCAHHDQGPSARPSELGSQRTRLGEEVRSLCRG
jgi:hypothetical protein